MSSLFDETDDDISLRTRRADSPDYAPDRSAGLNDNLHDREFTLNTGIVLALFFALVLMCAVFFGFGYSIGRKSAIPVTAAVDSTGLPVDSVTTPTTISKPAPGSPSPQPVPGYTPQSDANAANERAAVTRTPAAAPAKTAETRTPPEPAAAPIVRTSPASVAGPDSSAPSGAPTGAAPTYVQIAAVSHQEDADVLLSALTRRGYKVLARNEPTDKLIHVQIGPFANRKDAELTRQRLLADGYNAFLK